MFGIAVSLSVTRNLAVLISPKPYGNSWSGPGYHYFIQINHNFGFRNARDFGFSLLMYFDEPVQIDSLKSMFTG